MKTKILLIPILIFLISCDNNTEQKRPSLKSIGKLKTNTRQGNFMKNNNKLNAVKLNAVKLESLPVNIEWTDRNNLRVFFSHKKVYFSFAVTCEYWFPSKIIDNEIEFYWEINEDCTFDVGITKHFSEIKNPELGKPFGKIKILDDSTLSIDYYYSDWVTKINNEFANDTLFPTYLRKIELEYSL